jgi:hypothetical protein
MPIISKNNIGVAVLLLFVTVLSQSRVFDILINTTLGRILLIAFILFLSYANKIIGVVGVLFIIIMFNNCYSLEGFEAKTDGTTKQHPVHSTVDSSTVDTSAVDTSSVDTDSVKQVVVTKKKDKEAAKAAEGFDVLGVENNIRRGKQSNSIPVRKENNLDNDVFAYDSSSIFGSFSPW